MYFHFVCFRIYSVILRDFCKKCVFSVENAATGYGVNSNNI